jgi:hypothetical protein
MQIKLKHRWFTILSVLALCAIFGPISTRLFAQNLVLGEVNFSGASKVEKASGVWIDGQYVGYLNELKGRKKILLMPGEHEISVRQNGYKDFTEHIVLEPRQVLNIPVKMTMAKDAIWPTVTAELKVDIHPNRAAVFVDDKFLGHAAELGGRHGMLLSPGMHRIKIELPGYRTFESDVNLVAGQKSEVKTDLVQGSINQADSLIKEEANNRNR